MGKRIHWFLFEWRHSAALAAAVPAACLALLIWLSGALDFNNYPWYFTSAAAYQGMLLLMVLMPTYICVGMVLSSRRTREIALEVDGANGLHLAQQVGVLPLRSIALFSLLGVAYGLIVNVPGRGLNWFTAPSSEKAVIVGQVLIWTLLGAVLALRVRVSRLFRQASELVDVDIFEQSNLKPFAMVGLIDILMLVVGMVLATVQSLDFSFRFDNYSKALLVVVPAGIYLTLYPIWGIHLRMRDLRHAQLDELNDLVRRASKAIEPAAVAELETLLQRRERVLAAPTWPVDIAILQRLLFYIIIPPLAWVGAAVVELLVDGFLQR